MVIPGPGVVGEEDVDLVVSADVCGVELSEPGREGERAGGNCIKIGLPGKSILRDYCQENRIS